MPATWYRGRAESGSCDGQQRGKRKRGGARIIYVYVTIAARIYLIRCCAKNVKADLTADEKRQLRQIAAHLKGAK
jgi:hypothetical protein